jgi:hypothetical protein
VTLWVRDHGIGMSAEAMDGLFTKFYRVDNAETRASAARAWASRSSRVATPAAASGWKAGSAKAAHLALPRRRGGRGCGLGVAVLLGGHEAIGASSDDGRCAGPDGMRRWMMRTTFMLIAWVGLGGLTTP